MADSISAAAATTLSLGGSYELQVAAPAAWRPMMLTLFHAPRSRSSRIVWLMEELGIAYDLQYVSIRYMDGSGAGPDRANPHPDAKVPALVHDGTLVTESSAIALYLAELVPAAGLATMPGDAERGPFLTWLAWIEGEFGPASFHKMGADNNDAPAWDAALRRLTDALARGPYLMGERFTAADVMMGGTLGWVAHLLPDDAAIGAYLARLTARPPFGRAMARDAAPAATA